MRLDHVSYACSGSEIANVVLRIGSDLGVTFVDGGRHPSFGTRNFTAALASGSYIEVVSALDHPAALKAPFGQAVHARAEAGGGWLSWVVAVTDITPIQTHLGRMATPGRRIRPDGSELRWQQIGVLDVIDSPVLPFFVEWQSPADDHPSSRGGLVSISALVLAGDPDVLGTLPPGVTELVDVEWVEDEPGITTIWFDTPHGRVSID
ncbi:MAG: VOC family protein [Actinomycetota bacterium]